VTAILGLLSENSVTVEPPPRVPPIRERAQSKNTAKGPAHSEQIHALVQQLFFRNEAKLVRHVGFASVDASTEIAILCLEVGKVLAEEGRYDVGLIDARATSVPLQTQLRIPSPSSADTPWAIEPRLWMVPRRSWLPDSCGQRIAEQNLSRLRDLAGEFDFSILCCASPSWLTASIGQACDGLVLVLTANKTRRLVAAQIRDQLGKAQVPLLGTVLAERRFPVPQGLYRSL
jgi:hypothetical protein